jgi:hypothetical protein
MDDTDLMLAPLSGRPVTPDVIDSARRYLTMLCSLLEDARQLVPTLVPPRSGAWRSAAADHYIEGLGDLRVQLFGARDRLADAASLLEERIRRLQAELDAQVHVPMPVHVPRSAAER